MLEGGRYGATNYQRSHPRHCLQSSQSVHQLKGHLERPEADVREDEVAHGRPSSFTSSLTTAASPLAQYQDALLGCRVK